MSFWANLLVFNAVICLTAGSIAFGGDLEPTAPPESTSSYTMDDLYNRLNDGSSGSPTTYAEPPAGGIVRTVKTVNDAMAVAPEKNDTTGAVSSDVVEGKNFWGLTETNWGPRGGTMPNIGRQNISCGTTNETIREGYHDGTGAVVGDADLIAENIKQYVSIFGVKGTYKGTSCSGKLSAAERWCDNLDGTVTDMNSGLVWLKNANCIGEKVWSDTTGYDDALTWAGILYDGSWLFGGGDCGLSDESQQAVWRLPTYREFDELQNGTEAVSFFNTQFFSNIQNGYYWTSTTVRYSPYSQVWCADLVAGDLTYENKTTNQFYVWPVRNKE